MNQIKQRGYSRYNLMEDLFYEGIEFDLKEITDYFKDLPKDEYAPNLNRYRRYSRAIILPNTNNIFWLPTIEESGKSYSAYFQGKFNPEHPGAYRKFYSIDQRILDNKLLQTIILQDYKETFWSEEDKILPIHVGVHFVKLNVKEKSYKAVSSPNCLHQDGEPFTFAHLIERKNVKGGVNVIAQPHNAGYTPEQISEEEIIEEFEINKALESYGVHDPDVSHYVSPIELDEEDGEGVRSVLLIDYQLTVVADVDE